MIVVVLGFNSLMVFLIPVVSVWQILEETYKMEFMYSGVESRQVVIIHHMRLQAKALQLIVTARTTRG